MQEIGLSTLSERYGLSRSEVLWWNCHGKDGIENLSFEQRASRCDHRETELPRCASPNRIWERGKPDKGAIRLKISLKTKKFKCS